MNLENLVLGVGEKAVNSERKQEKAETNRVGRQRAAPKRNLPANHWKCDASEPARGGKRCGAAEKYAMANVIHKYLHAHVGVCVWVREEVV